MCGGCAGICGGVCWNVWRVCNGVCRDVWRMVGMRGDVQRYVLHRVRWDVQRVCGGVQRVYWDVRRVCERCVVRCAWMCGGCVMVYRPIQKLQGGYNLVTSWKRVLQGCYHLVTTLLQSGTTVEL